MTPADPAPEAEPGDASAPASPDAGGAPARKRRLVDLAPLRENRTFARLWIGNSIGAVGAWMTNVAVGIQIYAITESTFAVGLVGGISLAPMIVAGLWGGMLADVFDRRRVLMIAALAGWGATLSLVALSTADAISSRGGGDHISVWPFYIATTLTAVAATVRHAAGSSVVARILPPRLVSRAVALNGISFGIALTLGPAFAGVLAASVGLPWTFATDALLFTAAFVGIWGLPRLPRLGEPVVAGWAVLREGLSFLKRAPNIRMSFIVDIVAMTFGRTYALFPALGALVVGGGALTVGALTAAGAAGTILTSVFSGGIARVHRQGVAITRAITVFGGFAAAFGAIALWAERSGHDAAPGWGGIHWPFLVALAVAMAGMGASDEVSAIFRQTIIIQGAPDHMRGRLQGVFIVVVTGGPRVGDMYVGVLAVAVGLWFPPLLGGLAIIGLIAVLARVRFAVAGGGGALPDTAPRASFRDYDDRAPTP